MAEEFVTKKHFDESFKYLDEKIDSVLEAVNYGFERNAEEHEHFMTNFLRLDQKIDKVQDRLEGKIDNVYNLLDGYIKSREDSEVEFTILKHRVDVIEEKVGIEK